MDINDIVAQLGGRFTADEISGYITMSTHFVRRPIFNLIDRLLTGHANHDSIMAELDAIDDGVTKAITITNVPAEAITELGPKAQLNIWFALGDKDYAHRLRVPTDEFGVTVVRHYEFLRKCAAAVWRTFQMDNSTLYARIQAALGDSVSEIKMDPANNRTMGFDLSRPERIVMIAAWSTGGAFAAKSKSGKKGKK